MEELLNLLTKLLTENNFKVAIDDIRPTWWRNTPGARFTASRHLTKGWTRKVVFFLEYNSTKVVIQVSNHKFNKLSKMNRDIPTSTEHFNDKVVIDLVNPASIPLILEIAESEISVTK